MYRILFVSLTVVFSLSICVNSVHAQRPRPRLPQRGDAKKDDNDQPKKEEPKPLPADKRLIALHHKFVNDAEKLAAEYEKNRDWDKAKDVYGEIVKLVPQYLPAQKKLDEIREREAGAGRLLFTVRANDGWQDSGVRTLPGKPIRVRAMGKWTFTLTAELGPDGMKIPKELRDYNLGCLMAAIDTGDPNDYDPFVIGSEHAFVADKAGRLLLRMYDRDPKDNKGFLKVEFVGSFDKR